MRRLSPLSSVVTLDLEGRPVPAREGEAATTALLAAGETVFSRSVKYHRARGPFCLAGACSHCLMRVDGAPNVFACQTKVRPGMKLERQNAFPTAEHDVFGALDFLFPRGLDHHEMFAGVPVAEQVMAKVARHLAGLGLLPHAPAPERCAREVQRTKVAIIGGGAAGLGAANVLGDAGADYVVLEREAALGGRLRHGPLGPGDPEADALARGVRARTRTTAIGLFDDAEGRYVAAVEDDEAGPRLVKVYADAFLVTTGGYPRALPFKNNDLPCVFAGRAVGRLVRVEGLLPGRRFALAGYGPELYDTARLVTDAGGELSLVLDLRDDPPRGAPEVARRGTPHAAHGRTGVRGLTYKDPSGGHHRVDCDALVICLPPSPAFELARQGGAAVRYDDAQGLYVVAADADGRTDEQRLFAAGEVLGEADGPAALAQGARAARAILGAKP